MPESLFDGVSKPLRSIPSVNSNCAKYVGSGLQFMVLCKSAEVINVAQVSRH